MSLIVPPGGFAGFSQMTPASRVALGQRSNGARPQRRRRTKSKAKRVKRAKASGGRKIKFGSPAWRKKYKLDKRKKR